MTIYIIFSFILIIISIDCKYIFNSIHFLVDVLKRFSLSYILFIFSFFLRSILLCVAFSLYVGMIFFYSFHFDCLRCFFFFRYFIWGFHMCWVCMCIKMGFGFRVFLYFFPFITFLLFFPILVVVDSFVSHCFSANLFIPIIFRLYFTRTSFIYYTRSNVCVIHIYNAVKK